MNINRNYLLLAVSVFILFHNVDAQAVFMQVNMQGTWPDDWNQDNFTKSLGTALGIVSQRILVNSAGAGSTSGQIAVKFHILYGDPNTPPSSVATKLQNLVANTSDTTLQNVGLRITSVAIIPEEGTTGDATISDSSSNQIISGVSMLYFIIGVCVIGFLILAAIAIVIIVCVVRRKKGHATNWY